MTIPLSLFCTVLSGLLLLIIILGLCSRMLARRRQGIKLPQGEE